ncbi:MAG: hypothetical protein QW731_03170 [Thermofilaceae archaeon]
MEQALRTRRVALCAPDLRSIHLLYQTIRDLGLESFIEVSNNGKKVPKEILRSKHQVALFACWLAHQLERSTKMTVGIDVGARNIGMVILINDIMAYTSIVTENDKTIELISELIKLKKDIQCKIGYTKACYKLAEELAGSIRKLRVSANLVHEEEAKANVVIGDFTRLKKLSRHELDALRIALSPTGCTI